MKAPTQYNVKVSVFPLCDLARSYGERTVWDSLLTHPSPAMGGPGDAYTEPARLAITGGEGGEGGVREVSVSPEFINPHHNSCCAFGVSAGGEGAPEEHEVCEIRRGLCGLATAGMNE